jgi:serine/threonine protein phosphatase 1
MLLGNHEYMMLRALGQPYDDNIDTGTALAHWYRNGGQVTHDHLKRLRKTTRAQIIDYLLSLPLQYDVRVNGTDYRLVHAAPAEDFQLNEDPRYLNPTHFAVWRRWEADQFPGHDYTVIFGHTPTRHYRDCAPMEIWRKDGYIGIDCGCGYPAGDPYGRLCCLRLDDGRVFYSDET